MEKQEKEKCVWCNNSLVKFRRDDYDDWSKGNKNGKRKYHKKCYKEWINS